MFPLLSQHRLTPAHLAYADLYTSLHTYLNRLSCVTTGAVFHRDPNLYSVFTKDNVDSNPLTIL
jgi:hypothetical protein